MTRQQAPGLSVCFEGVRFFLPFQAFLFNFFLMYFFLRVTCFFGSLNLNVREVCFCQLCLPSLQGSRLFFNNSCHFFFNSWDMCMYDIYFFPYNKLFQLAEIERAWNSLFSSVVVCHPPLKVSSVTLFLHFINSWPSFQVFSHAKSTKLAKLWNKTKSDLSEL